MRGGPTLILASAIHSRIRVSASSNHVRGAGAPGIEQARRLRIEQADLNGAWREERVKMTRDGPLDAGARFDLRTNDAIDAAKSSPKSVVEELGDE